MELTCKACEAPIVIADWKDFCEGGIVCPACKTRHYIDVVESSHDTAGYIEFRGLHGPFINTGYRDTDTSAACPAANSIMK